jgi:HlyD family secretion protein
MMQSQKAETVGKRLQLRPLLIGGAVLLLAGGAYSLWRSKTLSNPAVQSAVAPQIKTITALGYLEPSGEVTKLSAPNSSGGVNRVEQLLVKRGEAVKAGQVIAVLDNRDRLQVSLLQAQKQVMVSRSNLAVVKAGAKTGNVDAQKFEVARVKAQFIGEERAQQETVARLEAQWEGDRAAQRTNVLRIEAELNNALSEFKRYQQLYEEGAISQSNYDSKRLPTQTLSQQLNEAKANLERTTITGGKQLQEAKIVLARIQTTSRDQVNAADATLDGIAEVRPVDVEAAQAQVEQSIAAVQQAQKQLDQATVRAPQDGTVLEIHTRPGELISSDGIVELGQTQQMTAVLEVYETDIAKVKVGQSTKLFADSLPDGFSGEVAEVGVQVKRQNVINSDTSANIDARVVEVRVRLDSASAQKVAGLTNLQVTGEIQQ